MISLALNQNRFLTLKKNVVSIHSKINQCVYN